ETHPLALGVFGNFGLDVANAVVVAADLVLAVGTKLGPTDTANENPALLDPERQTFVQVDIEGLHASWTMPAAQALVGDAQRVQFAPYDHAAIGCAMGCDGIRVERATDLREAIGQAVASGRPTVVDVVTSGDSTFAFGRTSSTRYTNWCGTAPLPAWR